MLLDCVECKIPKVDIVLARQVLQHLSNIQIAKFIRNLEKSCRYLIITEHLPQGQFVPNHDKATGPGIRLDDNRRGGAYSTTIQPTAKLGMEVVRHPHRQQHD